MNNWNKFVHANWSKFAPAILLVAGVAVVGIYLRANAASFVPVAESLTFVFQLMLAATVIAVLRNEIGISTFGVFGPVILAFAWLEVGPFWGFLIIAYAFVVTAAARAALGGLDLGTPHRIATLLVVASIAMFVMMSIGRLQDVSPFGAVLLFPVILTTWYAERFVAGIADVGWAASSRRLAFTLIAIVAAFVVAGYDPLVAAVIRTPEAWAGLVGANILLGAGTDVRLSEYLRFRTLRRSLGADNAAEVLTMRVRNRDFISKYNPASIMRRFDKARLKAVLHGLDIPIPETHLVVEEKADETALRDFIADHDRFVVKPVDGSGGRDVLLVEGRDAETHEFRTNRGAMTAEDVLAHIRTIRVGGVADYGAKSRALVESLVTPDGLLADRAHGGIPDIRVITLHGYPTMAMVRFPTEESHGTANLHTGAVAVAVDIATGEASGGYQQTRKRFVDAHPDTGSSLSFSIPDWPAVLTMASRAAIASGLGYAGVDIVFDADRGPMVLEVNRRPGLGIQNANMAGLLRRLRFVEAQGETSLFVPAHERVRRGIEWARTDWAPEATPDPDLAAVEVPA